MSRARYSGARMLGVDVDAGSTQRLVFGPFTPGDRIKTFAIYAVDPAQVNGTISLQFRLLGARPNSDAELLLGSDLLGNDVAPVIVGGQVVHRMDLDIRLSSSIRYFGVLLTGAVANHDGWASIEVEGESLVGR